MRKRNANGLTATVLLLALVVGACTSEETGGSPRTRPGQSDRSASSNTSNPSVERVTKPIGNWFESSCALPIDLLRRQRAGINQSRSPELTVVPREPNFYGGFAAYTHSGPWDYVQDVPVVLYGPGFTKPQGEVRLDRRATLADLAPTLAELLGIELPPGRTGKALSEALLPPEQRNGRPRLIVQIVWDGGGWNVLNEWPDAWPRLERAMGQGTSIAGVEVGSSPSVTPAVHATIGTGSLPKKHGIVDIVLRIGESMGRAYQNTTTDVLDLTTVADIYDPQVGNAARIGLFSFKNWHLGLIGHGSALSGGDKDIAAISQLSGLSIATNEDAFELPDYVNDIPGLERYIRETDISDGQADGLWMGHDVLDDPSEARGTPAWTRYQTDIMKTILGNEGFGRDNITDLFFINFKQIDDVGHNYNMSEPETREILSVTDAALANTIRWLNRNVGRNKWVIMLTADHGQAPQPLASGAWPIHHSTIYEGIAKEFGVEAEALIEDRRPGAYWIDEVVLENADLTLRDLANFFIDHRLRDNASSEDEIPDLYEQRLDEPIFAAAWPTAETERVWDCAKRRQRGD